jgi:hypothetical protein
MYESHFNVSYSSVLVVRTLEVHGSFPDFFLPRNRGLGVFFFIFLFFFLFFDISTQDGEEIFKLVTSVS